MPRPAADDAAIIDLLDTVREVRTTLAIDLAAAAGALEEDEPAIARDILAATSADLGLVGRRHAHAVAGQTATRRRTRRSRALIALPAVPLIGAVAMTAAAALSGAVSHHTATDTKPRHAIVQPASATTTLQQLEHVVKHHPRAAQVLAVADALHQQLTQMIATNNAAQLHVVQQLLTLEQRVLERSKVPGTQLALAASREIADLLKDQPSHPHAKHAFSDHKAPTSAPTTHAKPTAAPTPSHTQQVPQSHQSTSTTQKSPSPTPSDGLFGRGVFNGP